MKKIILIAMLTMLTACGNKFDGIYAGYEFASIFTEGVTYTLTVSGDEAIMANNYNDVIDVLEVDASDNEFSIIYRDKMLNFTFADDKKSLSCKGCFVQSWNKVEKQPKQESKEDKGFFHSLIEQFGDE